MKNYGVLVRGEGVRVRDSDAFVVARAISAATPAEAGEKTLAAIAEDWQRGESARLDPGAAPNLRVIGIWRTGILGPHSLPTSGHTFFTATDPDSEAAALRIELRVARPPLLIRLALSRSLQRAA